MFCLKDLYWILSISISLFQNLAGPGTSGSDARWQYNANVTDGDDLGMFFNTDFELLYELELNSNFKTTCELDHASYDCATAATYDTAYNYATNATLWAEDFSAVFTKMIENGYSDSDLTNLS